ncbi:carbonic anhydrase [Candidatus Nitrosoglobus terrae]|uniref:Carbonic anhydrase n=1 Tax=Candidatus Nitrosoglobus terrae TaxID=1630141 RepID=A0A1Q2SM54_9GAMM|nr:carbonic anhydrase [Candidatus Nitrosoglobus terrae]BAW80216.1 carbonic anhydrase [Candidatus Nitrosoglobus terrae]
MISAQQALHRLKQGNQNFINGQTSGDKHSAKRAKLTQGQNPFATILGCSDSRVPVEIVFDQGLGDLFVIRIAGNIVAPSIVGSVEFAVEYFDCPLVVVLGHSRCGAVKSTIDTLEQPDRLPSRNLMSIVNRVRSSIEPLYHTTLKNNLESLWQECIRANVAASVNQLRYSTEVLENMVKNNEIMIVGAEYSLETGEVTFFDF